MLSRLELSGIEGVGRFKDFPAKHFFTTAQQAGNPYSWPAKVKTVTILPENSDKILFAPCYCRESQGVACDGIFSAHRGVALVLYAADCLPILMSANNYPFIGLVHAGWRGTNLEIARKAAQLVPKYYPVEAEDIFVAIGPGIHKCCYDDEELANQLVLDKRWRPFVTNGALGSRIDLLDFNIQQLLSAGIKPEHIVAASECACCAKDRNGNHLFFSHHRAKLTGEPEGRFAAVIFNDLRI